MKPCPYRVRRTPGEVVLCALGEHSDDWHVGTASFTRDYTWRSTELLVDLTVEQQFDVIDLREPVHST